MDAPESNQPLKRVGRYAIFQEIAAGGMATVHLARLAGPVGFSRVVAVKCLHPHLLRDPQFKAMFMDEARLAARIRHPNVVPTLDVVVNGDELFLVMEYVQGEALSFLRRAAKDQKQPIPPAICASIMLGVLQGLHAAHEVKSENGEPLTIVHRDVSPQNVLVGVDGVARVLDFGVAKAMQARQETRPGTIKGKSAYMAPEQIRGEPLSRRADIFSASVVFWELLTGKRLFGGATEEARIYKVLNSKFPAPSALAPGLPPSLDAVVMKGLVSDPDQRYQTALQMAEALEGAITPASQRLVGEWVTRLGAESLDRRAEILKKVEVSKIVAVPSSTRSDPDASPAREAGGITPLAMGRSQDAPTTSARRDRRALVVGASAAAALLVAILWMQRSRPPPMTAALAAATPMTKPVPTSDALSLAGASSSHTMTELLAPKPEAPASSIGSLPVDSNDVKFRAPTTRSGMGLKPGTRALGGARSFRPTEL